jgi:hypothetical protein
LGVGFTKFGPVLGCALQGPYSRFCPQALLYTQKNSFWTLWASLLHGTHVVWPQGLNIWALYIPVLGGSHFLWEPAGSGSYIMYVCWEPDLYIYIYIYRAGENWPVLRIFIFSKFTWFSNRPVLAYMITVSSPVQFSQPGLLFFEINYLI